MELEDFVETWIEEQEDFKDFRVIAGTIMFDDGQPHIAGLIRSPLVKVITPEGPAVMAAADPKMFEKLADSLLSHRHYRRMLAGMNEKVSAAILAERRREIDSVVSMFLIKEVVE